MAFTWTTPIEQGDQILELALSEIRDNTDYIDDNPTCLTFLGTVYTNDYGTYETSFYTDYNGSERLGYNIGNYFPWCSGQTGGECPTH